MAASILELRPIILFAILLAGILPALFWLWFWLREDKLHPEPRTLIVLCFFAGALTILFAIPFEATLRDWFSRGGIFYTVVSHPLVWMLIGWALVEELFKFIAAFFSTYHRKALDEPVDYMIYFIAVAIGFAAFENTLFLIKSYSLEGFTVGFATAGMRFVGASLLHILASSIVGGFLGMAFCKKRHQKIFYGVVGVLVATLVHALFNFLLIKLDSPLPIFVGLWVAIVGLLLFFERIKKLVCTVPYLPIKKGVQ